MTLNLAGNKRLPLGREFLREMARIMELEYGPFENDDLLVLLISTVRKNYWADDEDGLLDLFRQSS